MLSPPWPMGHLEEGGSRERKVRAGRTGWMGLGPGLKALTAGSQYSPGQCSTGNRVPGVFLAPQPHQATVDGGKEAPPNGKATCGETEAY